MALSPGFNVLYKGNKQISLSEFTRPIVLMFSSLHHLVVASPSGTLHHLVDLF